MRLMKRILALLLAMMSMLSIPAFAGEETESAELVKQDPLLDAAFSMLEPGNPFLEKYNEITGAGIEPYFEYGLPYFFGGTHGLRANGELHLFGRAPGYTKRDCWEQTTFYDKGAFYLYGLDCKGYTRWICKQVGWPEHDELQNMILNLPAYGKKNHVYNSHVPGKEMPPYEELAETLLLGDMLVAKKGSAIS